MKVITSPEFIWAEASVRLPERMLPALKRWVALGTVAGDEQEHELAFIALRRAAPYVRKQLGFSLNLRHTPALHFVRDTVEEKAERVSSLLEKIEPVSERMKDAE